MSAESYKLAFPKASPYKFCTYASFLKQPTRPVYRSRTIPHTSASSSPYVRSYSCQDILLSSKYFTSPSTHVISVLSQIESYFSHSQTALFQIHWRLMLDAYHIMSRIVSYHIMSSTIAASWGSIGFAPHCTPSFGSHTKSWSSLRDRSRTVTGACRTADLNVCNMSNMSPEKRNAFSHLLSGS